MIFNLNIMLPEVFLTLSIFGILMIGVFVRNSFNLVFNLTTVIILINIAIILNNPHNTEKIFLESFIRDKFSNFFKVLILISTLFVLNSSKGFIIDKWEFGRRYHQGLRVFMTFGIFFHETPTIHQHYG